ncbi:MAG: hypothetical protein AABP62_11175 [Planctomycetota bacterium]
MIKKRMPVFVLSILGFVSAAIADVTDITYTPTSPIMGQIVTYTAVNDGTKPVTSYKWEYKYTSGTCPGTWELAPGNTNTVAFYEARPGTWQVRLTATYGPGTGMPPTPPPTPAVITKDVTIAPATGFAIVGGLDVTTARTSSIVVKFRVKAGTNDCGQFLSMRCIAQEILTDYVTLNPPFSGTAPDDVDWWPDTAQPTFKLVGNEIHDTKAFSFSDADWNAIPAGATFLSSVQALRLKYVDPCGTTKYISLGSIRIYWEKVGANNWRLYIIP